MARQAVPRPPWARRVEALGDGSAMAGPAAGLTMAEVRAVFATGPAAPDAGEATGAPGAAVLVVLGAFDEGDEGERDVPGDGPASVLLIRRAAHLRANPGEIAFPGGRIERGESPLAAALREAEEEVALPAGTVDVLGELPMVLASRREVPILPFVAAARSSPALEANPDEVDGVFVVPLRELVAPGRYWQERWDRGDGPAWVMHFFDLGADVIWGATARMLYELFLRLLSRGSGGRTGGLPGARTRPASRSTTRAS